MTDDTKYNFGSKRNDYMTPPEILDIVFQKIGQHAFSVDTCCTIINIPATNHFIDGKTDGLKMDWKPLVSCYDWAWCNPPYDTCGAWVKKAFKEQQKGNKSVLLIPARTETKFWHDYIFNENGKGFKDGIEVHFLRKGTCFIDPATMKKIQMKVTLKDEGGSPIMDEKTGEPKFKLVDGVYKNPLALVYFGALDD